MNTIPVTLQISFASESLGATSWPLTMVLLATEDAENLDVHLNWFSGLHGCRWILGLACRFEILVLVEEYLLVGIGWKVPVPKISEPFGYGSI